MRPTRPYYTGRIHQGLAIAGLLLLCGSVPLFAQATISPQTVSSGGETRTGGFGLIFSTIGEPIVSDSLGVINNESIYTGFWNVVPVVDGPGGVQEEAPRSGALGNGITSVSPNPFAEAVSMEVDLQRASNIRLVACDLVGRPVETLIDGRREAGRIRLLWRPEGLPSGSYLLLMSVDGVMQPPVLVQHYK